jgi:hypothetical protein
MQEEMVKQNETNKNFIGATRGRFSLLSRIKLLFMGAMIGKLR